MLDTCHHGDCSLTGIKGPAGTFPPPNPSVHRCDCVFSSFITAHVNTSSSSFIVIIADLIPCGHGYISASFTSQNTHTPCALTPAAPSPHHVRISHNDQGVVAEVELPLYPQNTASSLVVLLPRRQTGHCPQPCQCQALAAELGAAGAVSI